MISIPSGHIYCNALKRSGRDYNHDYLFNSTMSLSYDLYYGDKILLQLKNFGQLDISQFAEVSVIQIIDSISRFGCAGFTLNPISVDGVATSDEVFIPFSSVLGIEAANSNPYESSPSKIYALTSVIDDSIAQVYIVPYTVYDLWYYMNNCQFPPNPYYGDGSVLGGDVFLNL